MQLVNNRPISPIVHGDGTYNQNIESLMREWKFDQQGMNYYTVAIMGCQSSGKSTLLNMLFGTDFEVLDVRNGKKQTTLGVWLGLSGTEEKRVLVLDAEGCDSKERGEDHGTWERKTALFSLALSDVLLLNLWTHDVGRFEGANYTLLKVVFELNLKLFQTSTSKKTLLCFVFRDYDEEEDGSVSQLESIITTDINQIWNNMAKSDAFKSTKVTDFFDFKFCPLPHKMIKHKFEEGVKELQKQFLGIESDCYLSPKYKSDIPADGLPTFTFRVWDTIQKEKDLDLPSQKQMLAIFRCEEISKESYIKFQNSILPWTESEGESGGASVLIENFSEQAQLFVKTALDDYNTQSRHYDTTVVNNKRADLLYRLEKSLQIIFQHQIKILSATNKDAYALQMKLLTEHPDPNFTTLAKDRINDILLNFDNQIIQTSIPDFNWPTIIKAEREDLSRHLHLQLQTDLRKQIDLFSNQINKQSMENLSVKLSSVLSKAEPNMWDSIRVAYDSEIIQSSDHFKKILTDFGCAKEDILLRIHQQQTLIYDNLKSLLQEKVAQLDIIMDRKFKQNFDLDAHQIPRQWRSGDDIKGPWIKAKLIAEATVDLYAIIRLKEADNKLHLFKRGESGFERIEDFEEISPMKILITDTDCDNHLERFRNRADMAYRSAVSEKEHANSQQQIPFYFIVLFFLLGWNEFMWVLQVAIFNPYLLTVFLLGGGILFLLLKLNLLPAARAALSYAFSNVFSNFKALSQQAEERRKEIGERRMRAPRNKVSSDLISESSD